MRGLRADRASAAPSRTAAASCSGSVVALHWRTGRQRVAAPKVSAGVRLRPRSSSAPPLPGFPAPSLPPTTTTHPRPASDHLASPSIDIVVRSSSRLAAGRPRALYDAPSYLRLSPSSRPFSLRPDLAMGSCLSCRAPDRPPCASLRHPAPPLQLDQTLTDVLPRASLSDLGRPELRRSRRRGDRPGPGPAGARGAAGRCSGWPGRRGRPRGR